MGRTYLSWGLTALVCAVVIFLLWPVRSGWVLASFDAPAPGTDPEHDAIQQGRTIITYWDRSQGHEYEMHNSLVDEFNKSQDKIYVRTVSIGWRIEKLLTAISSGAPPDVCSMDGQALSQLAPQGCFIPLNDWMATQPNMREEDFFPHMYETASMNGTVYGIPCTTDVYCLLWNKEAFRKAGLDPERPPRTMEELQEFAAKLTVRGPNGEIEQIGFLPWLPWDFTYMWGRFFGGNWFNEDFSAVVSAQDPQIVKSLEWQRSWVKDPSDPNPPAYALDKDVAQAFYNGFSAGGAYFSATNPFYTGKVAMIHEGEWQCTFIPKYAPNLEWGVAPIPQPEGAPPLCYSGSCVLDGVPVGSKNMEEALTFLAWYYAPRADGRPSPASDYAHMIHNLTGRKTEAAHERFTQDPKFAVFVNELMTKPAIFYPSIPVGRQFADECQKSREYVMFGQKTAEQALLDSQTMVNGEWDRLRLEAPEHVQ
ncbi:MAG: ABC transporter substrate-binding protein [Candidatus Hydrogenedentes bacterium]|nr:ABC transporter substrate-binding protein [Candidatus Hydrogenedentota bacterium]